MERRTLELELVSAKDLKDVNFMSKMDVYIVVSLYGDSYNGTQRTKSNVVRGGGTHPTFNFPMRFNFDDSLVQQNRVSLGFNLASERSLGDRNIGGLNVSIKELFDSADYNSVKLVSYQLRRASGRNKGELTFSYKFGDKVSVPLPAAPKKVEPVMAYPVGGSSAPAYGYAPQQLGFGHPPRPPPPPVQRVQKPPKKKKKNKTGMRFGTGLLGGAIGGMVIASVVGDGGGCGGGGCGGGGCGGGGCGGGGCGGC